MSRTPLHGASGRRLLMAVGTAALAASFGLVRARAFPSKPMTLIAPWPAGVSTDRHHRQLAEETEVAEVNAEIPVQGHLVENKFGAGGTLVPLSIAATAAPDVYTISQFLLDKLRMRHRPHRLLMRKVGFDPINEVSFIMGRSGCSFGFVVRSDSPYEAFKNCSETARKDPCAIDCRSTGTSLHLLLEAFGQRFKRAAEPRAPQRQCQPDACAAERQRLGRPAAPRGGTRSSRKGARGCWSPWAKRAPHAGPTCPRPRSWATTWSRISLRPGRPQGHGPGRGGQAARRLQAGHGQPAAHRCDATAESGREVPQRGRLPGLGGGDFRQGQGAHRTSGPGSEVKRLAAVHPLPPPLAAGHRQRPPPVA